MVFGTIVSALTLLVVAYFMLLMVGETLRAVLLRLTDD